MDVTKLNYFLIESVARRRLPQAEMLGTQAWTWEADLGIDSDQTVEILRCTYQAAHPEMSGINPMNLKRS